MTNKERINNALKEIIAACKAQETCFECPCFTANGCFLRNNHYDIPQCWKLPINGDELCVCTEDKYES